MEKNFFVYLKGLVFWLFVASFFVVGFISAWFVRPHYYSSISSRGALIREGQQNLINPLLSCEISEEKEFYEFKPLKAEIADVVRQDMGQNKASSVSLYFRALNSGRWFGLNQDEKFSPASMLKVPVMIAYFKLAESNPAVLSKSITYQGGLDRNVPEFMKPLHTLQIGATYTIEDLISHMVIYSDNNAQYLLRQSLDPHSLTEVYTDLGLTIPKSDEEVDFMSPKTYGFIFRVLYGATYLNRFYSNKALELLKNTEFKDALVTGLPSDTTVVHKFGERTVYTPTGDLQFRELHDCGIIYYPSHPYLICVMTRGSNFEDLKATIADISRVTYNGIVHFFKDKK